MSDLYALVRPLLFALDAERSHELSLAAMKHLSRLATLPFRRVVKEDPFDCFGLRFANRVGLAAGLDKNGEAIEAFGRLGFGFVEVGTVTPRPQPGNPRPRLFRVPAQQALINRMGFNNQGVDALAQRVRGVRERAAYRGVIGINIGKNFDTPIAQALDDYRIGLETVYDCADYVTINISSPNTRNLRDLQERGKLDALLGGLGEVRARLADATGRSVPLLLKIAPDVDIAGLTDIAESAQACGVDGLIATNTTIARPGLDGEPLANQAGGLSGAPLKPLADEALRALRARLDASFPIIGVGGILAGRDALDKIVAGADMVQIYSGLIYRGPGLVSECVAAVAAARSVR